MDGTYGEKTTVLGWFGAQGAEPPPSGAKSVPSNLPVLLVARQGL